MEVVTPKSTRRSTRLRVEIPLVVNSLDRRHPFSAQCIALVVSPQGCGFRAAQALPLETPVMLSDLPGGATASGRIASCLPLGADGKFFLIGVSLYNPGNVWGISAPPEDWDCSSNAPAATNDAPTSAAKSKPAWPYNLASSQRVARPRRK